MSAAERDTAKAIAVGCAGLALAVAGLHWLGRLLDWWEWR